MMTDSNVPIRLLIIDGVFPILHGHWRIVEINYFLTHHRFDTDIYINPSYIFAVCSIINENLVQSFKHYYELYPYLNDYNIIIFNPIYNVLNQFNKKIDGTRFNNLAPGNILFTKKDHFDFQSYDISYQIFLSVRNCNTEFIKKKWWPSVCKIYPSAGYFYNSPHHDEQFKEMNRNKEAVIVSQEFIAKHVEKSVIKVKRVYGICNISPKTQFIDKIHSDKQSLQICFTSLEFIGRKGFDEYKSLAKSFLDQYKDLNIIFHVVGFNGCVNNSEPNIVYHKTMLPNDLFTFYLKNIDIIISPVKYLGDCMTDGFPLGSEAMIQGCIPILCDPFNCNSQFGFDENESLIMKTFDLNRAQQLILSLYYDCNKRKNMSIAITKKTRALLSPEKQLIPISNYLLFQIAEFRLEKILSLTQFIPDYIGGCPLDKALIIAESIINNQFNVCVDIGVWRGRSFIPIIIATKLLGGKAIGIDPYTAQCMKQKDLPQVIIDKLNIIIPNIDFNKIYSDLNNFISIDYPNALLLRKTAENAILDNDIPLQIDLIHIDGNHDSDLVEKDIKFYVPRVKSGGYIIMDAIFFDSVRSRIPLLECHAHKILDKGTWGIWQKN